MPHKAKSQVTTRGTTQVITRSMVVEGALTTISLEDPYWRDLETIARENDLTVAEVVSAVEDGLGRRDNLSSAIRSYIASSRMRH